MSPSLKERRLVYSKNESTSLTAVRELAGSLTDNSTPWPTQEVPATAFSQQHISSHSTYYSFNHDTYVFFFAVQIVALPVSEQP